MLRSVGSKVAWVGRTASMVFGLALVLALIFGVASMALGANGNPWILGQNNGATAITVLGGRLGVDGPMVRLTNNNDGTNDTALSLGVQSGEPPLTVNSAAKVTNLNADELDGVDSASFLRTPIYDEERSTTGGAVANESAIAAIACDPGDTALSGGFSGVDNGTHLSMSRTISASSSSSPTGSHTLTWTNNHTVDTVTLRVICADTRPRL